MINRGRIKDLAVVQEFEHLIQRLRGFLTQSFDADGELIVADPNRAIFDIGDIKPTARPSSSVQLGWLLCDGSQVSRAKYANLFGVVGTTHGVGDGSTTFNLPDLRGRFPLGVAASGTGNALGATGGSIDHTHTTPSHSHTISSVAAHSHTVSSHTHSISTVGTLSSSSVEVQSGSGVFVIPEDGVIGITDNTGSASPGTDSQGGHDHGGATGNSSGTSGSNNPPFIAVNYVIYTGVEP